MAKVTLNKWFWVCSVQTLINSAASQSGGFVGGGGGSSSSNKQVPCIGTDMHSPHRIFSLHCGMQTLSCGLWDLVPWPEIEPGPSVLRFCSLSPWTTTDVPHFLFIYYFGDYSFVHCFVCKYFLPVWGLSFHLVYGFICYMKAFKFK